MSVRFKKNETYAIKRSVKELQATGRNTETLLSAAFRVQVVLDRAGGTNAISDEMILQSVDVVEYPEWKTGTSYRAGDIVMWEGLLYEAVMAHVAQSHQPPGSDGMLAIYRPIQGEPEPGTTLPWVSGEAVEIGDRRLYDDVIYECYAPTGTNVWPPPNFPAAWREVAE